MREDWIDWSKAILIYLMIAAHAGCISQSADTLICGFHMPAFFMISGYLIHIRGTFGQTLLKVFKRIFIPIFFYTILLTCLNYIKLLIKGDNIVSDYIINSFIAIFVRDSTIAKGPIQGLWFLECLFIGRYVIEMLERNCNKYISIIFILGIVVFVIVSLEGSRDFYYYIQRGAVATIFMYVGYLMRLITKENTNNLNDCRDDSTFFRLTGNKSWFISIFLTIAYSFLALYNGRCGIDSWQYGFGFHFFLFIALLGSLGFFQSVKSLRLPNSKLIVFVSKNTLSILCLHRFILTSLHLHFNGFIMAIIVIIVAIPVIYLLNKYIPQLIGNKK